MISLAPRTTKPRSKRWLHRLVRFVRLVVMLEDTPRRIAVGSAIGMFFAAQPFVGSQMAAAALAARLSRASVLASLPWTWLTNPLTVTPFYYASYRLGCLFWPDDKRVSYDRICGVATKAEEMGFIAFFQGGWREVLRLLTDIALPLQIGALIVGAISALIGYFAVHRLVTATQARRTRRRRGWLSALALANPAGEVQPVPPGVDLVPPAVAFPADHLRTSELPP